ncbi:phage holin family protein [Ponticoccus sp. (in: a-proteobacteria)]|uniref:phage holin family protein n=1 Tax=Ponticoccus sp. (in: a-proteobacteria) TaxID=1925025 RepID=UPI003AB81D33
MNTARLVELTRLLPEIIALAKGHIQTELLLARREISEKWARAGSGVVLYIAAAVLAMVMLQVLAAAAVALIAASFGLSVALSALIVAGVLLGLALVCLLMARRRLSSRALTPDKTLAQLRADIAAVEEVLRARRDL